MADIDADVVVVGAGVAGLALAAQLGAVGHSVVLVDKAPASRDKVCGEGIMPLGLQVLDALGLGVGQLPGADFDALDYRTGWQFHTIRLRRGHVGRGLRRTALIDHLQGHALKHPAVSLVRDAILAPEWAGGRVVAVRSGQSRYRGRVIVAADGVNSVLARRCGAAPRVYGLRMALRRHYRLPAGRVPARVQVGLFGPYDVYLTPVGGDELLATTMTDRAGYAAIVDRYDAFLRDSAYGACFEGAEPASELLGWYHPLFRPADYAPGGVWLVGDASGGIDPCLGMGISMALAGARQAAGLLAAALEKQVPLAQAQAEYAAWRSDLFHHYHDFGKLFRLLVTTAAGSAALVRAMKMLPGVADRIFSSVAEMRPWPAPVGGWWWRTPVDAPAWRSAVALHGDARPAGEALDSRAGGGS
jgi:2-polyprenyl-6-methoxyphenol hydroxylase-like FAD-dependent oxidoreductase